MDEKTVAMIKERFDSLPEMVQNVIVSSNYENSLIEIGKKYQLNVEQLGILEQETTFVMMGLSPIKDFENELTRELKIDQTKSNQIVTEINEKIFLNIRALLKLMYTPKGEEPSVEEEEEKNIPKQKNTSENLNILEPREKMLEEIENVDLSKQKELSTGTTIPPAKGELGDLKETPSILTQKLSGSFQLPKVETEHFLNNLSKSSDEQKPKLPKTDPYRMPIE